VVGDVGEDRFVLAESPRTLQQGMVEHFSPAILNGCRNWSGNRFFSLLQDGAEEPWAYSAGFQLEWRAIGRA
jgi:hypothetical protein